MLVKLNGGFVTIRQNSIKFFRKDRTMKATLLTAEQVNVKNQDSVLETMKDSDLICASPSDFATRVTNTRGADYHSTAADGKEAVWSLWIEGQRILNKCDSVESVSGGRNALRPALSADETAQINPADVKPAGEIKGFETVFYGEFPQSEEKDEEILEKLNEAYKERYFSDETLLKETGKIYHEVLMPNGYSAEEYIFNDTIRSLL